MTMFWTDPLGTTKELEKQHLASNNTAMNLDHAIEAQFTSAAGKKAGTAQLIPPPSEQCELCLTCCSEFSTNRDTCSSGAGTDSHHSDIVRLESTANATKMF